MVPAPSFTHLLALSDSIGTFEHADRVTPRRAHGYCTDDVARVLIATIRQPAPAAAVVSLGDTAWRFLVQAQADDGTVRNRRSAARRPGGRAGTWQDTPGVADCWGRAVWAFGTAAAAGGDARRSQALQRFTRSAALRSPWPHAMAFAALGALEVLRDRPDHAGARALVVDAVTAIGPLGADPAWPWPLPRLTYANAVFAEVLLGAGAALQRPELVADGVRILTWLVDRETAAGHLSPTPVGGAGPGDPATGFDQQPIEVAAMADACARAAAVTGEGSWRSLVDRCADWFQGANDAGAVMWDPVTGGSYDGLHARGPNRNQGAESAIALITTLQHAHAAVGARA